MLNHVFYLSASQRIQLLSLSLFMLLSLLSLIVVHCHRSPPPLPSLRRRHTAHLRRQERKCRPHQPPRQRHRQPEPPGTHRSAEVLVCFLFVFLGIVDICFVVVVVLFYCLFSLLTSRIVKFFCPLRFVLNS